MTFHLAKKEVTTTRGPRRRYNPRMTEQTPEPTPERPPFSEVYALDSGDVARLEQLVAEIYDITEQLIVDHMASARAWRRIAWIAIVGFTLAVALLFAEAWL